MSSSDRIAVMNPGKVEQIRPPIAFHEEPATALAASPIGDTNIFRRSGHLDQNGFPLPREVRGTG